MVTLLCPVRGCGETLARGHSFDVARSGYVNLLQPQDRKSPNAGPAGGGLGARLEGRLRRGVEDLPLAVESLF